MFTYFSHYRINYHSDPYDEQYNPQQNSFFLVPLYIIVVAFPALVVSTFIYKTWKKRAAGYLVSLHN